MSSGFSGYSSRTIIHHQQQQQQQRRWHQSGWAGQCVTDDDRGGRTEAERRDLTPRVRHQTVTQ